jgi:hypothetical protein
VRRLVIVLGLLGVLGVLLVLVSPATAAADRGTPGAGGANAPRDGGNGPTGTVLSGAALTGSLLPPPVICAGTCGDGGGGDGGGGTGGGGGGGGSGGGGGGGGGGSDGSNGCWQETWWSDHGIPYGAYTHHYVVVQWCKSSGMITMIEIVQHGCDTSGFASCSTGPAYLTAGGVGFGWAMFEGHANISSTIPRMLGWNFTDVVSGSVAPG